MINDDKILMYEDLSWHPHYRTLSPFSLSVSRLFDMDVFSELIHRDDLVRMILIGIFQQGYP